MYLSCGALQTSVEVWILGWVGLHDLLVDSSINMNQPWRHGYSWALSTHVLQTDPDGLPSKHCRVLHSISCLPNQALEDSPKTGSLGLSDFEPVLRKN